jgi:hypothetical protein
VGIRCRECGRAERLPTYDVQPTYYLRAIGVAVAVAIAGGLLWLWLNATFGRVPFISSIFGLAVAYAIGELVSRSVNRKRGVQLFGSNFINVLFSLLFLGIAVYTAAARLR